MLDRWSGRGTRWITRIGLVIGLVALTGGLLWAQGRRAAAEAPDPPSTAELAALCQRGIDSFGVPGLAVGVIKDGRVVLSRGFGVRKRPAAAAGAVEALAVDEHTLFAIASNTKAFVGTSVALLAAEGRLSLGDRLSERLPYLKFADPNVTALANVGDLLAHRTGLGTFKGDHLWFKRNVSPREVLTQVEGLRLEYPFRAGYGYSNLGFIGAGEVIRAVSGQEWGAFAKTRFWEPLGMTRTRAHVRDLPDANFAYGHITRQRNASIAPVPWESSGAAGGIWSSASDMLRWVEANLGRGVFRGDTVWPAAVQAQVWRVHNAWGAVGAQRGYGLGWFLSEADGRGVVSHGGGYDGQYSQVMLVPELGLGIVVLSNSMTGLPSALAREIRDRFIGGGNAAWLASALAREGEADATWFARQDSLDGGLAARKGRPNVVSALAPGGRAVYRDSAYGDFVVREVSAGAYRLEFPRSTLLAAALAPAGGDAYRLAWGEQHAWWDRGAAYFTRDAEGRVHLRLEVPNDDIFYETIDAVRVE